MKPHRFRYLLVFLVFLFTFLLLILPIFIVFQEAFSEGFAAYIQYLREPNTLSAIGLTLEVAVVSVTLNSIFGVLLAFTTTRFSFPGKNILLTIIDSPFSVSPVVAGFVFILLFGRTGIFHEWLEVLDFQVVFNKTGLILATTFITFPFVTRELIPLMQSQGKEEEEAGLLLGANFFTLLWKVILPNIKWGLLYGVILCNARAMGEFGAVSVLSGHIRGKTVTLPLHIEMMYNEFNTTGAFAAATLLVYLTFLTLILKVMLTKKKEGANDVH